MVEFSIVYITYRPGGIDILADSLEHQTFKNFELIIVDDFWVDRRETVRKYLENRGIPLAYIGPSKPKCFPEIAFNVSNAFNTAYLLSTKEVIVHLLDYQWLPPRCLEKMAAREEKLRKRYCIVSPGWLWECAKERDDNGIISVWPREWQGTPSRNGCKKGNYWLPKGWEFACTAIPWDVIADMNGYPEWLDCDAAHQLEPMVQAFESTGALPYVDRENAIHIINHREWKPAELWHQAKRIPAGSTEIIKRENCFNLKRHVRGSAYWLQKETFDKPEYWCGELGYRPGLDGAGYRDFPINERKVDYIMSKSPDGKVLDIGCAFGYVVKRLREKGVDAWGIDISRFAISQAPADVAAYLQCSSADDLPFEDKEFDMVFSSSTFEHMPPEIVDKAISEAVRVAGRGIIAVTPGDDPHFDEDITHRTKEPLTWWRNRFPPEFEVRDDADAAWYEAGMAELVKLNLGSFVDTIGAGWINIDILSLRQHVNPEHKFKQMDLRQGLPYAENSVDLVRMSHLIEHLTLEESRKLLAKIHRVLKPGGLTRISTPSLELLLRHYRMKDMSFFNQIQPIEYVTAPTEGEKLSRIIFSGDYGHRAVYGFEMLQDFLQQAGFQQVFRVSPGFSYSEMMKAETEDQHVEVSLFVEAIK